jgi:hypothetical protein
MFWRPKEDTALAELKAARELFEQGKHEEASKTASAAEVHAKTSRTRNAARTTLAWVELDRGYVRRAKAALDRVDPGALDLYCYGAVLAAAGSTELAIHSLELARASGSLSCDGIKLLIDLCARRGRIDSAVLVAMQSRELLGADDYQTVLRVAREAGVNYFDGLLGAAVCGSPSRFKDELRAT